jgi:hypothetical protein
LEAKVRKPNLEINKKVREEHLLASLATASLNRFFKE